MDATFYPAAESFAGGSGTEDDPYQISSAAELALLSEMFSDDHWWSDDWDINDTTAYYVLTADITINDPSDIDSWNEEPPEYAWRPIGEHQFSGTFDGAGHTIRGLYVTSNWMRGRGGDSFYYLGLFGQTRKATICNVNIEQSYYENTRSGVINLGGIAGHAFESVIEGCSVEMTPLLGEVECAGGIVGTLQRGSLKSCTYAGVLAAPSFADVGGIAGRVSSPDLIEGNVNYGEIISAETGSDFSHVGGIAGSFRPGANCLVRNCTNKGSITTSEAISGGLFGMISIDWDSSLGDDGWEYAPTELLVEDCVNEGAITVTGIDNSESTGGIVADLYNSGDRDFDVDEAMSASFVRCENRGDISSNGIAGGVLGEGDSVVAWSINECLNTGAVSAGNASGGIVGKAAPGAYEWHIDDCVNEGDISSENGKAAGILAEMLGFTLTANGREQGMSVSGCVNRGTISCGGSINGTGGIVGSVSSSTSKLTVSNCVNEGQIHGEGSCRLGGIMGSTAFSDVQGNDYGFELSGCVNRGDIVHGTGEETFSEAYDLARGNSAQLDDTDAGDGAMLLLGGSSMGGIIGYCDGGVVGDCVNLGEIRLDEGQRVVISPKGYQGESSSEGMGTFWCGGVCGQFVSTDGESALRHCVSVNTAPIAVAPTLYESGITDVRLVSAAQAKRIASGLVGI